MNSTIAGNKYKIKYVLMLWTTRKYMIWVLSQTPIRKQYFYRENTPGGSAN